VELRVVRVDASVGLPLRQRVLRPHQTLDELRAPDDDAPDTGHYAAFAGEDVVATGSIRREPPPWAPDDDVAWRVRGMATAEAWRNRGVGAQVLQAILAHAAARGGGLVWCSARTPAVPFYVRAGFRARGDPWVDPVIGPHVAMERP